jgi:hypothetical protein
MSYRGQMKKQALFIMCLIGWLSLFYSCGYRLAGTGRQIPDHIHTIVIKNFVNKTTRYQAEQFVTFAVRDEFIRRSSLKLVENITQGDSLLEGEIVGFDVVPMSYSDSASANLYRVIITLDVRFIDLETDQIIFESRRLNFSDSYEIDSGDFFSQETRAIQKISKDFAASIVSTILENF